MATSCADYFYLKIVSYNINGTKGVIDCFREEFFSYLNSYDIIILIETFLTEDKDSVFFRFRDDYISAIVPAFKRLGSSPGRPRGGVWVGVRKDLNDLVTLEISEENGVNVKIQNGELEFLIIPIYLNNWESDFEKMKHKTDYSDKKVVLIGDFNCHLLNRQTSLVPGGIFTKQRVSKDTKKINRQGKDLLKFLEENKLFILNGNTKGDMNGKLTFVGHQGCSVIDYCVVSEGLLRIVEDFEVGNELFSDHQPLTLRLRLPFIILERNPFHEQSQDNNDEQAEELKSAAFEWLDNCQHNPSQQNRKEYSTAMQELKKFCDKKVKERRQKLRKSKN